MAETFVYGRTRHPRHLLLGAGRGLARLGRGFVALGLIVLALMLALVVVPRIAGYSALIVRGSSMGSAAPMGSIVIGRPIAAQDVRAGDVILIRTKAGVGVAPPVLHRVMSIQQLGGELVIQTRGDANPSPDPQRYVLRGETTSPVFVVPYIGFLVAYATTPVGWVLCSALPGSVLCFLWLRAIWAPERRRGAPARQEDAHGWASA